jgi:hypothetical protein
VTEKTPGARLTNMSQRLAGGVSIDPTPATVVLAVGDAAAIVAFAVAGAFSHGEAPVENPGIVVAISVPFLIGWAVVAAVAGLYERDAVADPRTAAVRTVPAVLLGVGIGLALRATPWFRGGVAPTFVLVAVVVTGSLLLGWRVLAAVLAGRA